MASTPPPPATNAPGQSPAPEPSRAVPPPAPHGEGAAAKYRLPPAGPTLASVQDRDRWEQLSDQSLTSVQGAAEKWRTGLAAFITLATTGLFISGPQAAGDMTTGWRAALTVLGAGGLLAAIAGLWLALRAAAGTPERLNLTDVVRRYGGVRQFETACALNAAAMLRWARLLVGASLLLLVGGLVTWWWAPPKPAQPPALIQLQTARAGVCGTLVSADRRVFRVQVAGEAAPERVPYAAVRNVRVVASC